MIEDANVGGLSHFHGKCIVARGKGKTVADNSVIPLGVQKAKRSLISFPESY